jgi:hypothetical protein
MEGYISWTFVAFPANAVKGKEARALRGKERLSRVLVSTEEAACAAAGRREGIKRPED